MGTRRRPISGFSQTTVALLGLTAVLLVISGDVSSAASSTAAKKPIAAQSSTQQLGRTAPQSRVQAKPSTKIEDFLNKIGTVRSLKEMRDVYEGLKFTQDELERLQLQLKKPEYSDKIQQLIDQEAPTAKALRERESQQRINREEREFEQRQSQKLRRLNDPAGARLRLLKAQSTMRVTAPSRPSATRTAAPASSQAAAPRSGENPAKIHSVTPAAATVGKSLTISGEAFGSSTGQVTIVVGREMGYCTVSSWSQTRIVVTVPEDLRGIVGESEKEGFVWVKLHGGETGPTRDLTVKPDFSAMTPEITSFSSETITPGQILIIEGRDFLTEQRGTVTFTFGEHTVDGVINEWDDRFVSVTLLAQRITGLVRQAGVVKLTNHLGSHVVKSITFEPAIQTRTLTKERTAWAIIIGFGAESTDFDFELRNGWKVADNYLEYFRYVGQVGAVFTYKAVTGSTHALSRVRWWVDYFGNVTYINTLRIEGPAGVPYDR